MLNLTLEGGEELASRLGSLPDLVRAALAEKIEAAGQAILSQVVGVNLGGGVLNARSGALRASIEMRTSQSDDVFGAEIFSGGDLPYAAIQEFGGKTGAHEILPDKGRALALAVHGKQVFARRVQHPGSTIPPRSYLRSALSEQRPAIAQDLARAVTGLSQHLKG